MTPRALQMPMVCLLALSLPAVCGPVRRAEAGDLELRPYVSVGQEYSDNILETADGRRTEFTTRVRPGALFSYRTPSLVWNTAYNFDYRHYARGVHGDEVIHALDLKATLQAVDHFLFLDLRDGLHRTTVNVARDVATESLLSEQTEQNLAFVSPYLLWRPTEKGRLRTGYRYADTRYWDGPGVEKREHGAFADFEDQLSPRTTLYASYTFTRGDASFARYDRNDALGGFKYAYAENSFIFGRLGNSWQNFSPGTTTSNLFWDAGVTHDFKVVTALLESKVQHADDPLTLSTRQVSYIGRLDMPFERGAIGLSGTYAEYFVTETDRLEHRRLTVTGTGRYDITARFAASAALTADRFSHTAVDDYPHRLTASAAVNYGFYDDHTALSLSYSYRNERRSLESAAGERVTNRVLLEIRTGI